jgi:hypothetical protein
MAYSLTRMQHRFLRIQPLEARTSSTTGTATGVHNRSVDMRFLRKSEQVVIFVDRLAIGAISLDSWIMKTARKHIMNLRFWDFPQLHA